MSVIGTFTPAKDGGWTGSIRTLTIDAKLRLAPNDNREKDNAPAFRVLAGNSRVGDAWEARTAGDASKPYWRLRLDDPALPAPFAAALFPAEDGETAQLVWNRRWENREEGTPNDRSSFARKRGSITDEFQRSLGNSRVMNARCLLAERP